jgi:lipoprotein-releasing system ATP-binding protein
MSARQEGLDGRDEQEGRDGREEKPGPRVSTPFLDARGIFKSYHVGDALLSVLRNLDLEVGSGEMVAIVGASGVGKSTLLHVLGGLDRADRGTVSIGGVDVTGLPDAELVAFRNRHVGFVFQFHHLLPEFNALENVIMPMRIARTPTAEARPRAEELLLRVGLGDRLTHRPGMLSGGEQQRVAVARALVMRPSVLLADEPTGDLDEQTADSLHLLMREMHRAYGLTSLIATHNPRLAAACDRVLRLEVGRLAPA